MKEKVHLIISNNIHTFDPGKYVKFNEVKTTSIRNQLNFKDTYHGAYHGTGHFIWIHIIVLVILFGYIS